LNYNILFLTLSTFSSTGGVQKVSRAMSHALNRISNENPDISFKMFALNDDNIADTNYIMQTEFKGCEGNKILFALKAAAEGAKSNTIIISHINLLSIAILIKMLNKSSKIIMMAHGTEVWRKIATWKKVFIKKHVMIWAVSNFTGEQLKNIHKVNPDQISTLHNCIDPFFKVPSKFSKPDKLLNRYNLLHEQPILLSIARLTKFDKAKGYDQTIEIIPQLLIEFPGLRYLICGQYDKKEKNRLEQLIKKYDLNKTIYLINFITEEELEEHYQLADVFILPSKKEGFGLVFIEAAACGCRVVAGNTDGSTDAMLNGQLGILVDPENPGHIKEAVAQYLRKPFNYQEAKNIQKICLDHFSHDQYIKQVKNLLFQHE